LLDAFGDVFDRNATSVDQFSSLEEGFGGDFLGPSFVLEGGEEADLGVEFGDADLEFGLGLG